MHGADADATREMTATAKRKAQQKPTNRYRYWSEEELKFCIDFWVQFQANNPGQKAGLDAGVQCVEAMRKAGYNRSVKGVLARFKKI
ncbi:hypothetical protein CspeluHIS016_0112040 [Cutaneotrichosporon spelunceum]|uniref:Myb/SANT-like domain-containing protein n=1 Tax=Cutaneotrichosporon spelunceum TaxID=1672016 RepID=A0AAD3TQ34_9TREE|nr:hypothetical protein CspeluHIS016_0112040 [Cutaneotrichosporon spelunceum]